MIYMSNRYSSGFNSEKHTMSCHEVGGLWSPGDTVSVFAQQERLWSPFCTLWLLRKRHLLKWARTCYYRRCPKDEYKTNCCIWLRTRGKMEIRRKFLSLIPHPHLTTHSVQQLLVQNSGCFFYSETSCDLWHSEWALTQSASHRVIPHLP